MAIDMPMTAEAVVAYLGIVLAGCVVVGIADSFAAAEIASRLRIAKAKAIITQVTHMLPMCRLVNLLTTRKKQAAETPARPACRAAISWCCFYCQQHQLGFWFNHRQSPGPHSIVRH